MPEASYEDRLRAFDAALAARPVRAEDSERMASILAVIRTREDRHAEPQGTGTPRRPSREDRPGSGRRSA